jgi:acyl-CoA reductase-like NAD-dependent aldehyde dehydrogenase
MSRPVTSTIEVRSPVDGRLVAEVTDSSRAEVAAAVDDLRAHQPAWEGLGPRGRAQWLRKLRDWLLDEADHLADVLQAESGKPRAEAQLEAPWMAELINYFSDNAADFLADERVPRSGLLSATKRMTKVHRPYAVVGVISPWNYPLAMPGMDVIPALIAGAAVLLKPSEVAPLSALELARGWREIGAPPVLAVATGTAEAGRALVDLVDFVQFTGSTRTGRLVAHQAVDRLVPYSLELGGKDPAIVLADADLDRAVAGVAWGALFNSGQACVSIERVYVEEPVHDDFVARLTRLVEGLRHGEETAPYSVDLGAMATAQQRDLVHGHVVDAVAGGARVLTGGAPTGIGTGYLPTVLVDVDHTMSCIREETFGPTIPVVRVADAEEAIRLANDSTYGLSATLWTRDLDRAQAIARRLDVGAVNINDAYANLFALTLPHGGWKTSGTGARFGGAHGLRKYTRQQAITAPRFPGLTREPAWFPYSRGRARLTRGLFHAVAARDLRRRLPR